MGNRHLNSSPMLLTETMNNGPRQQHPSFNVQDQYSSSSSFSQSFPITDHDSGVAKRCRGDDQHHYQQSPSDEQSQHRGTYPQSNEALNYSAAAAATNEAPLPESSSKRSRTSNYVAPRTVRPSVLTATGSLAGGTTTHAFGLASSSGPHASLVHHRRQLSGGAIEQFIGGHDNMDADTNDHSRPRSMSF